MIARRKSSPGDTVTIQKQRYVFGIALIAVSTLALCILMYVSVNLYLMIKVGHAPDAGIGQSLVSGFLETLKLVVGID